MPAQQPQVGETWEMHDATVQRSEQAAISELTSTAVRLVSRMKRVVVMPHRSFELSWRFVHEAPDETCADCPATGFLQAPRGDRWVWVCERHTPNQASIRVMLPGDTPTVLSELPGGLDQCPRCRTTTNHEGSRHRTIEGQLVNQCGQCSGIWILLMGRGRSDDGHFLAEQIIDTADALHGRVTGLQGRVGSAAIAAIRRAIGGGTWRNGANVAGVSIETSDDFGTLAAVLIGDPGIGGIQTLGGGSATVHNQEEAQAQIAKMADGRPRTGETWFHNSSNTPAFIIEVGTTPDKDTFVKFREGNIGNKDTSNLWLAEFLKLYTLRPPEPPCAVDDEMIDVGDMVWTCMEILPDTMQVRLHDPEQRPLLCDWDEIRRDFKPLKRRSAHERLMDDNEEIDFSVLDEDGD